MLKNSVLLALLLPTFSVSNEADGWPSNIESEIWEYFAHVPESGITSIISVDCTPTKCEILLTNAEVNPKYVDAVGKLMRDMPILSWNVKWSSTGRREIAPNVKAFVITISNVNPAVTDGQSNRQADPIE